MWMTALLLLTQQWTATFGSQVGTGVLGEVFGNDYARFHIRGLDIPAYAHVEGITLAKASAPSTPRYTSTSDGLLQFTLGSDDCA